MENPCLTVSYIPEGRLPDLSYALQKQHDGHLITLNGLRVGLEVEAFDWKSGWKLEKFAAQCINSITNERVHGVLILVQNEAALKHYSKPFKAGTTYCPEWVKRSGKWLALKSSETTITPALAARVSIELIRSEAEIKNSLTPPPSIWMPSAMVAE